MDNEKQSVLTGPAISESLVMLVPNEEQNVKENITVGRSMAQSVMEYYSNLYPWLIDLDTDDIENALYDEILFDEIDEDSDDNFRY